MDIKISRKITVALVLSEEEAHWLKANMQNPLHGFTPENEPPRDRETRLALFATLDKMEK